jgi:hypothetical protein
MNSQIFYDVKQYVGKYDISGDMNRVDVQGGHALVDTSCFGHRATRNSLGLENVTITAEGIHRNAANAASHVLRQNLKLTGQPYTVVPNGATAGNPALFCPAMVETTYSVSATVGEKAPFNVTAMSEGQPLIELGKVFIVSGSRTANGNSVSFQMPAVTSGKKLYAVAHVLSADGTDPTLDILVQSDAANSFGSPANVVTFTQFTDAGAEAKANSSVNSDTWYRVEYTIDSADDDGDFSLVIVIGVQ